MRIAIAGGHGKIALQLEKQLSDAGHDAIALIRNPDQSSDVLAAGGIPIIVDLEKIDVDALGTALADVDAVVFAAGSGGSSPVERNKTVDRDGAILLADAAQQAGIGRYVIVSSMGADSPEAAEDDGFRAYLEAKGAADADIRSRDFEWTIIRPGTLTDDPGTGRVTVGESTGRGSIPRADVAGIIVSALTDGIGIRAQFEAISGDDAIADAVAAVKY